MRDKKKYNLHHHQITFSDVFFFRSALHGHFLLGIVCAITTIPIYTCAFCDIFSYFNLDHQPRAVPEKHTPGGLTTCMMTDWKRVLSPVKVLLMH